MYIRKYYNYKTKEFDERVINNYTCPRCVGSGQSIHDEYLEKCPECDGTGQWDTFETSWEEWANYIWSNCQNDYVNIKEVKSWDNKTWNGQKWIPEYTGRVWNESLGCYVSPNQLTLNF